MKLINKLPNVFWALFTYFLISGCGSYLAQPFKQDQARLGEATSSTLGLKNLPAPKDKIVVAVYKFRDQTGQYKPTDNGTSWSTAVTQGATSILLKALDDSGWFIPIERENVSNLLNERKIIRSSRAQFGSTNGSGNENDALLPPLLYAGVMLEGGIISYDANVITGGAGLRYFGVGGSSQYRQDRVTVYLRAVSTSNGKILKTVYTSKTILSQQMDAGLFQFVRFSRLLEIETGFTYNEPSEMAVTEAIEKAVMSLIIEGVLDELWLPEEPQKMAESPVKEYLKEKESIPKTDIFGESVDNRRSIFALNFGSTNLLYQGDFPDPVLKTGIETGVSFSPLPNLSLGISYGLSSLSTKKYYHAKISCLELNGFYRFSPYYTFTPFLKAGLGGITENVSNRFDYSGRWFSKANVGGGFEMLLNENIGFFLSADYNFLFNDRFDLMDQGKYNDRYWRGNIGLNFYFGKKVEGRREFHIKNTLDSNF